MARNKQSRRSTNYDAGINDSVLGSSADAKSDRVGAKEVGAENSGVSRSTI